MSISTQGASPKRIQAAAVKAFNYPKILFALIVQALDNGAESRVVARSPELGNPQFGRFGRRVLRRIVRSESAANDPTRQRVR